MPLGNAYPFVDIFATARVKSEFYAILDVNASVCTNITREYLFQIFRQPLRVSTFLGANTLSGCTYWTFTS